VAAEVERGAGERRHRHPPDYGDFFGAKCFVADDQPAPRSGAFRDQFNRRVRADPLSTVQRRRRGTRCHRPPARPQPGTENAVVQRRRIPLRHIGVTKDRPIPPAQLVIVQLGGSDRFAAYEHVPHEEMVGRATDTCAEIDTSAEKFEYARRSRRTNAQTSDE
jgi:hypothetical protein